MTANEIIDFWFSDRVSALWFASTPAFDKEVYHNFDTLWQQGMAGQLSDWQDSAKGCLALVLLFDQFPLNMYRDTAKAFESERQAVAITQHALTQGFDALLTKLERVFLYMPLMHSEVLAEQEQSVQLFKALGREANTRFAEHHYEIVARFGRFPHRNAILGRENTAEEKAYLDSPEAFTG